METKQRAIFNEFTIILISIALAILPSIAIIHFIEPRIEYKKKKNNNIEVIWMERFGVSDMNDMLGETFVYGGVEVMVSSVNIRKRCVTAIHLQVRENRSSISSTYYDIPFEVVHKNLKKSQ